MRNQIAAGALALATLSGCQGITQAQVKAGAVAAGQLFCAVQTVAGPLTVTVLDAAGVPVIVTGLAKSVVDAACAAWKPGATPVVPAAVPVPSVAIPIVVPPAAPKA